MIDCAIVLTTYNRPNLVQDAIASVLEQECERWRLYIMDDGCNETSRDAIKGATNNPMWYASGSLVADGAELVSAAGDIVWWQGPQRPMADRKASIPYSRTINIALNHLLQDEQYVCYLVDDDYLYPESIRARAEYLDAHSEVHVVYGRSRSVQFGADGSFNTWNNSGRPSPGRYYPRPTGMRVLLNGGQSAHTYFANEELDPETHLPYVEEAIWYEGPILYGREGKPDHNQVLHRRECLRTCRIWPYKPHGSEQEFWGESLLWGVGDAAFFSLLGAAHEFYGVDAWVCTKRFHAKSDGVCADEVRE